MNITLYINYTGAKYINKNLKKKKPEGFAASAHVQSRIKVVSQESG